MSSTNNAAASINNNTNTRNVRQRANPLGLESLPDDTLLRVASYLSHTTRALLSVALTAPSTSYDLGGHNENEKDEMAKKMEAVAKEFGWQPANSNSLSDVLSSAIAAGQLKKIINNPQHQALSKASKIVMSNPYYYIASFRWGGRRYQNEEDWKELDLLDLDKSLRMRLTDGDIAGILVCIDAMNNLEKIRLPHCINVRGDGLAPLRGSVVLKLVHLSIVSEEVNSMTPKLSIDAVLPILDSIMAMNQNSLIRLHMPKVWHGSQNERLSNFLMDRTGIFVGHGYNQMSESEKSEKRAKYLVQYGLWGNIQKCKSDCHTCSEYFDRQNVHQPVRVSYEDEKGLESCPGCELKFCSENHARKIKKCDVCKDTTCEECSDIYTCTGDCGRTLCTDCKPRLYCHTGCDSLSATQNCIDCAVDGSGYTRKCGECNNNLCKYCDPDLIHLGTGERACEVCRGVDEADWHGPDNPAEID